MFLLHCVCCFSFGPIFLNLCKAKCFFLQFVFDRHFLLCGSRVRTRWEELLDCCRCSAVVPNQKLCLCAEGYVQNARKADCTECNPAGHVQKMVNAKQIFIFIFKQKIMHGKLLQIQSELLKCQVM